MPSESWVSDMVLSASHCGSNPTFSSIWVCVCQHCEPKMTPFWGQPVYFPCLGVGGYKVWVLAHLSNSERPSHLQSSQGSFLHGSPSSSQSNRNSFPSVLQGLILRALTDKFPACWSPSKSLPREVHLQHWAPRRHASSILGLPPGLLAWSTEECHHVNKMQSYSGALVCTLNIYFYMFLQFLVMLAQTLEFFGCVHYILVYSLLRL